MPPCNALVDGQQYAPALCLCVACARFVEGLARLPRSVPAGDTRDQLRELPVSIHRGCWLCLTEARGRGLPLREAWSMKQRAHTADRSLRFISCCFVLADLRKRKQRARWLVSARVQAAAGGGRLPTRLGNAYLVGASGRW